MQRLFRVFLYLFVFSFGWAVIGAESNRVHRIYSLDESIRIALEQSGKGRNARRDQAIADAKVTQARSEALPKVSLSADYTRLDETQTIDLGGETSEMGSLDNYSATASINQLLYSGGRVGAALRAAGVAKSHAEWTRRETELAICRDVRNGFCDILLTREAAGVSAESLARMELLLKQTRDRAARGAASEFEVLTAQVKVANEKPVLILAQGNESLARESFRRLLGIDEGVFDIDGTLSDREVRANQARLEGLALDRRPALHAAEAMVRLLQEDAVAARAGQMPSVSAFAAYNGANAYRFVSFSDQWEWHWSVGLQANWSIWDGGLTRGQVRERELAVEKGLTDLDELRKSIRLEVRQGVIELDRSRQSMRAARETVGMAEKALAIARTRHEQGLSTYLEFSDASLALSTARLALIRARGDHRKAIAGLMHATGLGEAEIPDDEGK